MLSRNDACPSSCSSEPSNSDVVIKSISAKVRGFVRALPADFPDIHVLVSPT